MHKPRPRRRNIIPLFHHLYFLILHKLLQNFAIWVSAEANFKANHIWVLFIKNGFDQEWASVMHKSLASWLHHTIKISAELILNEISNIFSMVNDIVLHDSAEDNTKRTLIVKSIGIAWFYILFGNHLLEVHICAFFIHGFDGSVNLLESVNPSFFIPCMDYLIQ